MPRYVVGFDGTEASHAAVRFATRLGSLTGAEVIVAHVYTPVRVGHMYAVVSSFGEEEERAAEAARVLEGVNEEGVDRRLIASSSPAHGLHSLVEEEGADLLAVGTTHHGVLGRLVPGGEAERLLHGSSCPIAVVPADGRLGDVHTVAVAYDGGEEAEGALAMGEALARALGARLLLVYAVQAITSGLILAESREEIEAIVRAQAERIVTQAAERLPGDLRVESRVVRGPARQALVHACEDVDLLVMGSRAYGPLRSVLLGSVSRHVIDHAPCPVIVVPRGARTELRTTPEAVAAPPA